MYITLRNFKTLRDHHFGACPFLSRTCDIFRSCDISRTIYGQPSGWLMGPGDPRLKPNWSWMCCNEWQAVTRGALHTCWWCRKSSIRFNRKVYRFMCYPNYLYLRKNIFIYQLVSSRNCWTINSMRFFGCFILNRPPCPPLRKRPWEWDVR